MFHYSPIITKPTIDPLLFQSTALIIRDTANKLQEQIQQ